MVPIDSAAMSAGPTVRRVALVHDFLLDVRGAERVFMALCDLFPDADLSPLGVSPRIPFVRTNSVAWSLTFCGTVVPLTERRSD